MNLYLLQLTTYGNRNSGVLFLCVAVTLIPVRAQPSFCSEDVHCSEGYYCEKENKINECRECLSCEDLMREPPAAYKQCIKSVADCGDCINNLVVDRRADVNSKCVPPDTSELQSTPPYVWIFIGIGVLLLIAAFVGIAYFVVFKTPDYDNQSSTVTARITATAPEAPPPYNPLPQAPYHSPVYNEETTAYNEDEQFIKRPLSRPQDARESAGNQAARVYDKPIYERDLPPPAVVSEGGGGDADGSSSNLPALLAAARDTTLVEHPAAKKRCVRQDSLNNNRDNGSCGDSSHTSFPRSPSPSHGQGGPPYSFITQITNVVQINTSK
ncbi:hypothetical protein HF086_017547 [Spodoptera exigua]|uniref:Uncharacterized protein n=1 Tax=Spodoptera exigua TaxID=7107 RepID=A0A922N0N1_SPOEX|nr:hypothetical protein HF086_017547 [Spodoptera exigua]